MEVSTIEVAREQASEQYRLYSEAVKKRREPYLHDLKVLYGAMRTGKVVLDVWQSFKETGLDANGDPKIAIARADWPETHFHKFEDPAYSFQGVFRPDNVPPQRSWRTDNLRHFTQDDVTIPLETWTYTREERRRKNPDGAVVVDQLLKHPHIRTKVPIVPVAFLPPHGLSNYHILWEVEKWDVVTPPRDPLLLKRVSPNMFVVLAAWELTDLERAVLRGRIA